MNGRRLTKRLPFRGPELWRAVADPSLIFYFLARVVEGEGATVIARAAP